MNSSKEFIYVTRRSRLLSSPLERSREFERTTDIERGGYDKGQLTSGERETSEG